MFVSSEPHCEVDAISYHLTDLLSIYDALCEIISVYT
jgi:hypothetical protein